MEAWDIRFSRLVVSSFTYNCGLKFRLIVCPSNFLNIGSELRLQIMLIAIKPPKFYIWPTEYRNDRVSEIKSKIFRNLQVR